MGWVSDEHSIEEESITHWIAPYLTFTENSQRGRDRERSQQDNQALTLPSEVDVGLPWRVCLFEIGHLMRRQGAPKALASQPGEYLSPRYAERRADYGEQRETPPCDFLRRPNFILDPILRVIHI